MFAENDKCASSLSACIHAQLHIGLDAAYCPGCRESFNPHSKEYQRATNRDRTRNIALVQVQPAPEHLYQPGGEPQPIPYQVRIGDRVKVKDDPYSLYEIGEISDGQVKLHCLAFVAGARAGGDRSVTLSQIQFLERLIQHESDSNVHTEDPLNRSGGRAEVPPHNSPPQQPQPGHNNAVPLNDLGSLHDERYIEDPLNRSRGQTAIPSQSRPPQESQHPVPLNTLGGVPDERYIAGHGWIEKYMVKKRWEHHRYCWQMGGRKGKVFRMHIPRDSGKLLAVRSAIAMGQSPQEIQQLIKSWRTT